MTINDSDINKNGASVVVQKEEKITVCKIDSHQGFLRSSFNLSAWEETTEEVKKSSKVVKIAGALFYFETSKHFSVVDKTAYLDVILLRKPVWDTLSHNVDYTFCLLGSSSNQLFISGAKSDDDVSWSYLVSWSKLINKDNGFVNQDGNFVIQVEFCVKPETDKKIPLDLEFLDSSLVRSDSKDEKNQDEVELQGVVAAEFAIFLKAIYQPMSEESALLAGNTVESMREFFEELSTTKMDMGEKLQLAQDYNLSNVMDFCVAQCKTMADLARIFKSSQYSLLDSDTKDNKWRTN
uniref:MATH domain-containing protein n=1 Tax=Ditylenchus dipsaci TaxID=166011 RepID=A0A915E2L2_9BILA